MVHSKELRVCDPNEVVAMLRAGNIEAVERLAACYGARLRAAARKHCRSDADAEDAFQDALVNAWHARNTYRGEGRLDGWMVRLVASACSRMRRGRKNAPELHVVDRELDSAEPTPEQAALRSEISGAIGRALGGLSPDDRVLLFLADGEDWRGPELAQEMGLTAGAVRTRLSRARARIREELRPVMEQRLAAAG